MLLPMDKILLMLLLVTTACLSAPDDSNFDISKEIDIIFGHTDPAPSVLTTTKPQTSTATVVVTDADKNANEDKSCRIEHQVGICTPYYHCKDQIQESVIDLAFGDPEEHRCDNFLDVCCSNTYTPINGIIDIE